MTVGGRAARADAGRNYFAMMMLDAGDADGVISGLTRTIPATIRPALQIVGHGARASSASPARTC